MKICISIYKYICIYLYEHYFDVHFIVHRHFDYERNDYS